MPKFFRIFKETNTSPNARFLRTSYGQKIIDAFFVFAGASGLFGRFIGYFVEKPANPNHHINHLGILDFSTLFISLLLDHLVTNVSVRGNLLVEIVFGVIWVILGLIAISLHLIRIVIAAILAFNPLSLFIILVIHAISQYVSGGAALNQQVANIQDVVVSNDSQPNIRLLDANNPQKFTLKQKPGQFDISQLPPFVTTDGRPIGLALEQPFNNSSSFHLPLFKDQTNAALTPSAYSVLKLNTWRVTERMEEYVAANRKNEATDDQVKENIARCEQVLRLVNEGNLSLALKTETSTAENINYGM